MTLEDFYTKIIALSKDNAIDKKKFIDNIDKYVELLNEEDIEMYSFLINDYSNRDLMKALRLCRDEISRRKERLYRNLYYFYLNYYNLGRLINIGKPLMAYGFRNSMTIEEAKCYIKDLKFVISGTRTSNDLDKILKLFEDKYQIITPQVYYHKKSYPTNVYFDCFIDSRVLMYIRNKFNQDDLDQFLSLYDEILLKMPGKYQLCINLRYIDNLKLIELNKHFGNVSTEMSRKILTKSIRNIKSIYRRIIVNTKITEPVYSSVYEIPVDVLCLSLRSHNGLARRGIRKFIDLYDIYLVERIYNISIISSIRNVGNKSYTEIIQSIETFVEADSVRDELAKYKESFNKPNIDSFVNKFGLQI